MTPRHVWSQIVIGPDVTIEDAVKVINAGGQRIALIADAEGRLAGTLTDGDVRRAIIAHVPLSSSVTKAMNAKPQVARVPVTRDSVIRLMKEKSFSAVPVLDDAGQLTDVFTLHDTWVVPENENPVLLMAGGFGTRLRPLTDDRPKPMLKLGNKPILETTLDSLINAGFRRFFISVHYLPEKIKSHFGSGERWGVDIRYVEETEPLGTAGALSLLPETFDRPMMMMNGDVVTSVDFRALLDFHMECHPAATMCVRQHSIQVPYGVVQGQDHRVRGVVEKPIQRYFVNAGIYVLSPDVVASVPKGRRIDMPELVNGLIAEKRDVNMFPIHEDWLDVGRMEDFNRALGQS